MKAFFKPLIFSLLLLTFSCSKEEDCDNPVDCLPPATQIGANTAGCLVNGEVLLPKGRHLGSGSVLHFQYLNYNGGYLFSLSISDISGKQHRTAMITYRGETKLEMGKTYVLAQRSEEGNSGVYLLDAGFVDAFVTTDEINGGFTISFLDESKRVLSGEFWFDAINNEGEVIDIREGRFDLRF